MVNFWLRLLSNSISCIPAEIPFFRGLFGHGSKMWLTNSVLGRVINIPLLCRLMIRLQFSKHFHLLHRNFCWQKSQVVSRRNIRKLPGILVLQTNVDIVLSQTLDFIVCSIAQPLIRCVLHTLKWLNITLHWTQTYMNSQSFYNLLKMNFLRMCHHLHPEAVIDEQLLRKLRGLSELSPIVFFTDGSCQHPSHRTSRAAAYSIVLDVCVTNDQRRDMARQFQLTGCIPDTLKVISVARTTGAQSIYRSELFVCEWLDNTVIYSDSSAALLAVNRCQLASNAESLCMASESDLLQRLWPTMQHSTRVFHKIKAHNDPRQTLDLLECYFQLGNLVADTAAVQTAKCLNPDFATEVSQHHSSLTTERNMLHKLYSMHLEMSKCRTQLAATMDDADTQQTPIITTQRNFLQEFCNWVVVDRWTFPVITFNNTKCSAWGATLSRCLLEWFRNIHWPTEASEPDSVGITWLVRWWRVFAIGQVFFFQSSVQGPTTVLIYK